MMSLEDLDLLSDDLTLRILSDEGDVDITELINSTLTELDLDIEKSVSQLETAVFKEEESAEEINKIFADCQSNIDKFKESLKLENNSVDVTGSESEGDDDVQFVQTTYDPAVTGNRKSPTAAGNSVVLGIPPTVSLPSSVQIQKYQVRNANGDIVTQYYIPPQANDQPLLTPSVMSPNQPQNLRSIVKEPTNKQQQQNPGKILQQPPKHPDLVVGMKLYAKKQNDVWYKGTLVDILNRGRPRADRRYKIKFDEKGVKVEIGKHVAFSDTPSEILPVGSRILGGYTSAVSNDALYRDELGGGLLYYAGIVAEPPSLRNNHRYLVFFDDGYAQYCTPKDIHKIFEQSENVWEDTFPDSQDFIRDYLQVYPERPMVRLQKGQQVKTEWNGKWWVARVQEVDASLVKMYFESDRRVEWIYRGSTRLEPLYTELAQHEASKQLGRARRHNRLHNLTTKSHRKPLVEYTRGGEEEVQPPQRGKHGNAMATNGGINTAAARGGNMGQMAQAIVEQQAVAKKSVAKKSSTKKPQTKGGKDMATVLQERMSQEYQGGDGEAMGMMVEVDKSALMKNIKRRQFTPHQCNPRCIREIDEDPEKFRGENPLLIPQLYAWERQITKQKSQVSKRGIMYRAPCGRKLRYISEVDQYLRLTNSKLTIDQFCFDPDLHTSVEYVPLKTFCDIKDLSYGKESVPISCVNGIDRQYPEYVEYSNQRIPAKGVKINLNEDYLICCDCTDGCRDPSRCQCIQLSIEAARTNPQFTQYDTIGYEYRRLNEPLITGIYECNSRCRCDNRCSNRVVQHGLNLRLQVFKTEKRGWGIRSLDDISAGRFICIYAGQLLTEQGANEDGQQYGDEYLAELDYIEVVERGKEGYESDANEDEGIGGEEEEEGGSEEEAYTTEGEEEGGREGDSDSDCSVGKMFRRKERRKQKDQRMMSKEHPCKANESGKRATKGGVLIISDDDSSQSSTARKSGSDEADKPEDVALSGLQITEPTSLNTDNVEPESEESDREQDGLSFKRATRSGSSRFRNLPDPRTQRPILSASKKNEDEKAVKTKKDKDVALDNDMYTRSFFGEEFCYVMDAKSMGNIGRYLNHSCSPNVFVQNVFVDTHDIRFPWVAFFAAQYIKAGTELTWDYNYEVGSVPGKVLYCYCGSAECRGRLL